MNKIIVALIALVLLSSCTYRVKFGKACTPNHGEWSYVWKRRGQRGEGKLS